MDTPWQLELLSAIEERTTETADVAELWVLGSARQPELLDQWSDLDIGLVLTGPVLLQSLLHEEDLVWAVDHQAGQPRSTARVVLADGRRLDVVVSVGADLDRSGGRCVWTSSGSVQPGGGRSLSSRRLTRPQARLGSLPRWPWSSMAEATD
ncbi:MAG TPA: hypothetical protein VFP89_14965 [Propionibacteriaceae bacterium]|nr:hypothetical protein [Propionibacteriaceae bacterium]